MMASLTLTQSKLLGELLLDVDLDTAVAHIKVAGLTLDSRQIKDGFLFIAIQGAQVHGKDFIPQAEAKGANAILFDAKEQKPESALPVIAVNNLAKELSAIASRFYDHPTKVLPVIGYTGTNGKTTCTLLTAQAMAHLNVPCGVIGTLGYGLVDQEAKNKSDDFGVALTATGMTTADAIQMQSICKQLQVEGAKAVAMEVSSHGLVQHRVEAVDIKTAVFTNLTHDHLDFHQTMEEYGNAKLKLFLMPSVESAVINTDDDFAEKILECVRSNARLVTYGLQKPSNLSHQSTDRLKSHFSFENITAGGKGMQAVLRSPEGEFSVSTQLIGHFNLSNLLAVIAVLWVNKFSVQDIVSQIPKLKPVAGRMELLPSKLGYQVVIDYAHTPDALKNALKALLPFTGGKLWCVFGCGGDRDRGKRPEMASVVEAFANAIVVTNDNPRSELPQQIFTDIQAGFSKPQRVIADRAEAIDYAITHAQPGDAVLIAGKGHEDYQLIGKKRIFFSDQHQARLSLRKQEVEVNND
jgi:UDP-N-acetylmuramoyl-L-alanyl-D-glutamate--2,6-diaminopimelate ligase